MIMILILLATTLFIIWFVFYVINKSSGKERNDDEIYYLLKLRINEGKKLNRVESSWLWEYEKNHKINSVFLSRKLHNE
jgi:hypothetical protein